MTPYDLYQIIAHQPKVQNREGTFVRIPVNQLAPFKVSEDDLMPMLFDMDKKYGQRKMFGRICETFPDFYIDDTHTVVVEVNPLLI